MKKETETTLFTTEATQQKEHTTHNLYIFIRCHFGPLLLALVFAPCRFPLQLAALSFAACYTYRCQWRICSAAHAVRQSQWKDVRNAMAGISGPGLPRHCGVREKTTWRRTIRYCGRQWNLKARSCMRETIDRLCMLAAVWFMMPGSVERGRTNGIYS